MTSKLPFATVLKIAALDLWHERLSSFCVALGLAAVIGPLTVLFGLRDGTIASLRQELVEDPVFREIRQRDAEILDPAFFEALRAQPEASFVVESIARGAAGLELTKDDRRLSLDMIASAPGDPLLLHFGDVVPTDDMIVLSESAASMLEVEVGEEVQLRIDRNSASGEAPLRVEALVAGVLDNRADSLARAYVSLDLALDIERYRSGQALPERGWTGRIPWLEPVLDGVVIFLQTPLPPLERGLLTVNTGFFELAKAAPERRALANDLDLEEWPIALDLSVIERGASPEAISRVRRVLGGRAFRIVPYVDRSMDLTLDVQGQSFDVFEYSIQDPLGTLLAEEPATKRVTVPSGLLPLEIDRAQLVLHTAHGDVGIPVDIQRSDTASTIGLPLDLASRLRRALEQPARFDTESGRLLRAGTVFNGFRLYATSIDDVGNLQSWLGAQGIETESEIQAIERIRILDAGLQRLFWLIAAIAILGAVLVLLASLLAAVERKVAEIAQLRLLGLSQFQAARFPLHQGMLLTACGCLFGLFAALIGGAIINLRFASDLGFEGEICRLESNTLGTVLILAMLLAPLTALTAARRVTRIEPSEALRHE